MTKRHVAELAIAVGRFTGREVTAPALLALAADDRERHNHPIADLELLDRRAHLDHLAHEFVSHHVAFFHRWHEVVEQMQIGPAYGTTGDLPDGVPRFFDLRIRDGVAANIFLAVPN